MIGPLAQLDVLHMRHDYLLGHECWTIKHNSLIAPSANDSEPNYKIIKQHEKRTGRKKKNSEFHVYYLFLFEDVKTFFCFIFLIKQKTPRKWFKSIKKRGKDYFTYFTCEERYTVRWWIGSEGQVGMKKNRWETNSAYDAYYVKSAKMRLQRTQVFLLFVKGVPAIIIFVF